MTATAGLTSSLVLTGNGAYSAYEVGVMGAFFAGHSAATRYEPFDPDLLIGTSIGAMNAAVLAAQEVRYGSLLGGIDALRTLWLEQLADAPGRCGNGVYRIRGMQLGNLDPACLGRSPLAFVSELADDAGVLLNRTRWAASNLATEPGFALRALIESIDVSALVSLAPFLETLRVILPLDDFARTSRKVRIVASDLTAGQPRIFTENDVQRLAYLPIAAATALPIFVPAVEIEGHVYLSGNSLTTSPLLTAIPESNVMHVVYMDPDLSQVSLARLDNFIDMVDRVLSVSFAYRLNRDTHLAGEINAALELIEQGVSAETLTAAEVHTLLGSLSRVRRRRNEGRPYAKLTIHSYHPRDDIGGELGLMKLDPDHVFGLIERGYRDAVEHDCEASGCVVPGRAPASRIVPPTTAASPPPSFEVVYPLVQDSPAADGLETAVSAETSETHQPPWPRARRGDEN